MMNIKLFERICFSAYESQALRAGDRSPLEGVAPEQVRGRLLARHGPERGGNLPPHE